jgi:hypothetical protein
MIDKKHKLLSVRAQCGLLDLNRSSLYYQQTPLAEDTEIANRIGEIFEATPQYGYRRIHAQLIREGETVNRKKVQRLMGELKSMLSSFIHWYNEERLHSSLKYKMPMEVLKMTKPQTYGDVDNSNELPTSPQVQQQPQLHYCLLN